MNFNKNDKVICTIPGLFPGQIGTVMESSTDIVRNVSYCKTFYAVDFDGQIMNIREDFLERIKGWNTKKTKSH